MSKYKCKEYLRLLLDMLYAPYMPCQNCVVCSPNGLRFARLCRPSASIRVRTFWRRRYAAGNSLGLVAQTSMRLSLLRQGAFSGLPRRGKIFGCVRKPLLQRRVFRSSLAKTRRFAPFTAELMPNMS